MMTATDVRDRARSLADLPNAQVITPDDELNSLNEAWHDVYEFLEQNDDDYYLTETVVTLTAAMASPTNLTAGEWWIPLPSDLKSIRYLDYNTSGRWLSIDKAPLSSRNIGPANPKYRIRGAFIWIFGGYILQAGSQIRIGYYPVPANITLPLPTLTFGTSYGAATLQNISIAFYTQQNQSMVYVINSTTIAVESITNNTVSTPLTLFNEATSIGEIQYYKGYLYWMRGANIYRAATGLTATIAAASAVTATTDVLDFSIIQDTIYYCVTTAIKSCTLTGGSVASLGAAVVPSSPAFIGSNVYYFDSSNNLKMLGVTATIMANVKNVSTDGAYLYILDTSNNLTRASVASTTLGTLATLSTDTLYTRNIEWSITSPQSALDQPYIALITRESPSLIAIGGQPSYNFSYPNNVFTELISYQMAIDFRVKAAQDPLMLVGRLGSRDVATNMTGLWLRMYQSLKRDDYQPQRINNRYAERYSGIW